MNLQTFVEPMHVWKRGEEVVAILTPPSKLKIQLTGPGAQTMLDESPPSGKVWRVLVRVEIVETDG